MADETKECEPVVERFERVVSKFDYRENTPNYPVQNEEGGSGESDSDGEGPGQGPGRETPPAY